MRTIKLNPTFTRQALAKVPEITVIFWLLKLLSTGMGEAMSDYMALKSIPIAAFVGVTGFCLAIYLQLRRRDYNAPNYWFAVMMVAVFGTMVADGLHRGAGIPYAVTTPFFAISTAVIFIVWYRVEGTLSIHTITSPRRELFYWLAVCATFALGTAAGDLTAFTLNLGFWPSAALFAALISLPALGWWRFDLNPVVGFWIAYVLTRPLGASFADGLGKGYSGGLGIGDGIVSLVALAVFVALVGWVTVKRIDVQPPAGLSPHPHPHAARGAGPRLGLETE